jgi:hypothetical protein
MDGATMARMARTAVAPVATLVLALVAGCSSQPGSPGAQPGSPGTRSGTPVPDIPAVVLDEHANHETVQVVVGHDVELLLHSTYWMNFGSSQPGIVRVDGSPRVLATASHCVPGGGCNPVLARFTAASLGTAVLSASRTSCGEALACGPANSHFSVTIRVVAH